MILNICLGIIIVLTIMIIASYNCFIRANNTVKESTSAIDVLLKQRFELLPNIIVFVKGYTKHESKTLEDLVKLRNAYNSADFSVTKTEEIEKKFAPVMALVESYPELKANEQFLDLQRNLVEIEDKINRARLVYNHCVTKFNNLVESVPSNIVAKIFGFEKKELFKIKEEEKQNVKVKL